MKNNMKIFGLLIASTAALSACAPKIIETPPPAQGTDYGNNQQQPVDTGTGVRPGSQEDFLASVTADRIFFDTDRFNIDTQDQIALQSQAQWLARYPNKRIIIEGHADERGTREYNLALGERRANSAKNYLASLGVSSNRIQTVSYGKERPDALGSDESAWARNRRAVTVTVE